MVESVHQHHSSVPVPGHRRISPHNLFAPPLQWSTLTPSCHQLSPSPKKTQRGFIIADKLLKWIEYAYKIAFYLKSYMKSHSCLQWIDKTIISSIYLSSPIRTNTLRVFWPRCSLGGRAHTCPLWGLLLGPLWRKPGLSMKNHNCHQNRDGRAQQTEHMPGNEGFLHMWPLLFQVSAVPFLGLPHMSPSSSSHIMIYILKTNQLSTVDKNCCNKVIATYFSLHFVYWDKLIKRHKHRVCLHGHYNKHIH